MHPQSSPTLQRLWFVLLLCLAVPVLLSGCGSAFHTGSSTAVPEGLPQGRVYGGSQPIGGATVQLYAAGTTGDGSAATPLLSPAITTAADGSFDLTGAYTCPTASSLVYVVASGGNPGLAAGTNNSAIALMTALGACGSLSPTTYITVNEATTVAAVNALSAYMTSVSAVGSGTGDVAALTTQFGLAAAFVDSMTGSSPGSVVPSGYTVPVATINTLANIAATCVNSVGGAEGDGSSCGNFFTVTQPPTGVAATNTATALLLLANNPSLNTPLLFGLAPASAPFQPQLTVAPANFAIQLTPEGTLTVSPSTLTFPDTYVVTGYNSAPQMVTVTNTSSTTAVSLGLSQVSSFAFSTNNGSCVSIAPGASCSFPVVFSPTTAGQQSATLTINSNASNAPQTVALSGTGIAAPVGYIGLSGYSLTFTEVNVPQTITVTNAGNVPLIFGSMTITGALFTETNNCGTTLAVGGVCGITVVAPTGIFGNTGYLTINDSATGSPQTVTLNNQIVSTSSGGTLQPFGQWAVGTTSLPNSFSVNRSDSAGATLTVTGITGSNASDFKFTVTGIETGGSGVYGTSPMGCSDPIGCSAEVEFTPSGVGTRTATLETSAGNVSMTGTGIAAGPSFTFQLDYASPSDFPDIGRLINNGSTDMKISAVLTAQNASDLTLQNQCTNSIPGTVCQVSIVYNATQVGSFQDTLTLTDTLSGYTQSFPFTTELSPAPPSVSESPVAFGYVPLGTTSAVQTVTVSAPNNDPIVVLNSFGKQGVNVVQGASCASTPCTLGLTWTPAGGGSFAGSVSITDTVTNQGRTLSLTGSSGTPAVTLSATSLSFPLQTVGTQSSAQNVTLTNSGTQPMQITAMNLTGTNSSDFGVSSNCPVSPATLAVNGQCIISMSFTPMAAGTRTATVQLITNAPTSPDLIQLSGTAQ